MLHVVFVTVVVDILEKIASNAILLVKPERRNMRANNVII